jgi:hypothetical protein
MFNRLDGKDRRSKLSCESGWDRDTTWLGTGHYGGGRSKETNAIFEYWTNDVLHAIILFRFHGYWMETGENVQWTAVKHAS